MLKLIEDFNVNLYSICNIDDVSDEKYHLLDLQLFKGDILVKQIFIYIHDDCFSLANTQLNKKDVLQKLIDMPKYSRIKFESTVQIITI